MGLADDVAKVRGILTKGVRAVRARRHVLAELGRRPRVPDGTVEVAVYFTDGPENLYQLDQWYEPLRRLHERHHVTVLSRNWEATRALLADCPVPVHHAPDIDGVEAFLGRQPVRAILYVNQNQANFSAMRFADPAHVFICHGESDKDYMSSNQLKAYDHVFVAGDAAKERIARKLVGFDDFRLVEVGRPQVDVTYPGPTLPDDGRTVVLFAPTWEGDRASMRYSSVASHGPALVRSLVATGRHRVVFRPHPRTGIVLRESRAALDEVIGLLREANRRDPAAQHVIDVEGGFGWQLAAADVAVMDVSAVAYDWLATAKPLLLTRPAEPSALLPDVGLTTESDLFDAADAVRAAEVVDAAVAHPSDAHAALVQHYFGDTTPGASMARFLDACDTVVTDRAAALEVRNAPRTSPAG
ncbi:CDP-glycerol glycerophosphotransferase family protein [Oryzobacter telluris]|uniref:CDP-glycerol glycerophosphotransferase family protein n=1 Tax=Oryzobacter telluris TaxID=3149179 RepID=UPI00370D4A68